MSFITRFTPKPATLLAAAFIAGIVAGPSSLCCAQQFTDVSIAVGLVQTPEKSWGNPIWGDINNDGYLDLIVPDHGLLTSGGPFVYLNNHGQSFTDIRSTCGIGRQHNDDGDWHGYAFGDYDGDGNLDLYIAEGAKGNRGGTIKMDLLFKGNGDGTFTDVAAAAGIQLSSNRGRGGFWVDYDNDGILDLLVKNFDGNNVLYKGNGDGTFTPATNSGLDVVTKGVCDGSIVSFADYDNDGYMDVFITGDANSQSLYHNNGDGTFTDVTAAAGIPVQGNANGIAWGDYNNDGLPDLFIARGAQGRSIVGCSLYRNNGDGTFTDVTAAAGLNVTATCWVGVWGDYDNDGYLDLFVTNSGTTGQGTGNHNFLFHNNGDGTFTDVGAAAGVAMEDGVSLHKGAAWGDYNNDGFLDLVEKDGVGGENSNGAGALGLHFLFRNNRNANNYLKLNLKGVESNLHGIGSRVTVSTAKSTSYRQNNGGGGGEDDSESSVPLHFGLGHATSANVTVTWPSGIVDQLNGVAANSTITITEGSSPVHK